MNGTINVAATNPFDLDLSAANAAAKTRDGARDAYNQDGDPTKWAANWAGVLGINLAVYDSRTIVDMVISERCDIGIVNLEIGSTGMLAWVDSATPGPPAT